MSEDYLVRQRRNFRNRGIPDSVESVTHHFGRNPMEERIRILEALPQDDDVVEMHDLDSVLERRKYVHAMHRVHAVLLRQKR